MKNKIKLLIFICVISICCSTYIFAIWVPDAWDMYPEEFHKIYEISSKYVARGMNLKKLTVDFKGKHYNATPIIDEFDLTALTNQFKQDNGNADIVGWIYVPDTVINYPILQHPSDTDFYAKRNYEKFENPKKDYGFPGIIWIDSDCNFSSKENLSQNTVFYGHNWENYTDNPKIDDYRDIMFSQLNSFHHFDYAKNRPYIYISTEKENMVLKIFAVFYTEDEFNYHIINPTNSEKLHIMQEALDRSRFIYDAPLYLSDNIFTFSTCTRAYGKGRDDQKFVIMARLLRDDESVNDKLSSDYITIHKGHKEPKLKEIKK